MFYEIGFGGPWDVAAGALILTEAGGVVIDPAGVESKPPGSKHTLGMGLSLVGCCGAVV